MSLSQSKRNFLLGRVAVRPRFRPPWALPEAEFTERCTRCGECIKQCPSNVIQSADGGYPEMNFNTAGCDFCEVCVAVCGPQALRMSGQSPLNLYAEIADSCFAERGVICRACGDTCETNSIRFTQVVGGITHVTIDFDSCSGCGECVSICPADSISMQHRTAQENPV